MDIKIEGNPGTGNTFQEIHIGTVQNYNPNATTVINNNYGNGAKPQEPMSMIDRSAIRQEIITYVGKTLNLVEERWKPVYIELWNDILDLKEVSAEVYDRGRQQKTIFNRKLIANIIYYLGNFKGNGTGLYGNYSATPLVKALEGTTECSTRTELGSQPSKEIRDAITPLLKKHHIV